MLQLHVKQSTHYSRHLCDSNLLNCLTIFKYWKYTYNGILIRDFMLAHMHAKTSNVYSEQCGKISDFQSETTKPTIVIKI